MIIFRTAQDPKMKNRLLSVLTQCYHNPSPGAGKAAWVWGTISVSRLLILFDGLNFFWDDKKVLDSVADPSPGAGKAAGLRAGRSRDTVRQRSAANSIVSSRLDPTEVEQSDCNCESPRSQWAVKMVGPLAILCTQCALHILLKSDRAELIVIKLLLIRCAS